MRLETGVPAFDALLEHLHVEVDQQGQTANRADHPQPQPPPRLDIENIVGAQHQTCRTFLAERLKGEAGVDQGEGFCCGFKRSNTVLRVAPFNLDASIDLVALCFDTAEKTKRRDPWNWSSAAMAAASSSTACSARAMAR